MIVAPVADHIRAAQEAISAGQAARSFLLLPAVREWFVQQSVSAYEEFVKADGDGERLRAQLRTQALNELYESLTRAVTLGDVTAERLVEQAQREESRA